MTRTSRHERKQRKKTQRSHTARKAKRRRKLNTSIVIPNNESTIDLENINEALRTHKSNMAQGKGSWKVMPKDSCEVYKKRQERDERNNQDEPPNDDQMNENEVKEKKKRRRRVTAPTRRRYRQRKKVLPEPQSTETSSYSSCTSYSEMDYDD